MLIARSTFSRASAWKGNRPRETMRSLSGEEGWSPFDGERVSPSKANPFRPRYANCRSINLTGVVKSAIHDEVTCVCSREVDRGGWGERALKEQRQVPGDPFEQDSSCLNRKVLRGTAELRNLLNTEGSDTCRPLLRIGRYETRTSLNDSKESITWSWLKRKSDRPIVAKKGGNSSGAKGSSFSHVTNEIRRSA